MRSNAYYRAYDAADWLLLIGVYPTPTVMNQFIPTLTGKPRSRQMNKLNGPEAAGRAAALYDNGWRKVSWTARWRKEA